MSLDAAALRAESPDFAVLHSVAAFARSISPWLQRLGPVLLIRDSSGPRRAHCLRSCAIDTFGVRETLHFDHCRVYRLADSDYYGWDHVAAQCTETVSRRIERVSGISRRAHLVRSQDRAWLPVSQLSALGWQQVREIVQLEGARLEHLPVSEREL